MAQVYGGYRSSRKRRSWDIENPGNQEIRAELVATVWAAVGSELHSASRLLDVGCGTGWWLEELSHLVGAELFGIDLLPDRVRGASARVPSATVLVADARTLPFQDGWFGVVSLFTVLSSMPGRAEVKRALAEARRVLAPRGALVVWEPRMLNPLNRHTHLISRLALQQALPDATWQTQTLTLFPPLARRLGRQTHRLYPRLSTARPLRSHQLSWARWP